MALSPSEVVLYAASEPDYQIALGAALVSGISASNVIGSFTTAWNVVNGGQRLVLAVGGDALNALYYNPCGWAAPNGQPGGHTPFTFKNGPVSAVLPQREFLNAAGYLAQDTYKLAVMLAYYATHGSYPTGYGTLTQALHPVSACQPKAQANATCPC